jgi:amino acid adenylation domain-containing protein
MENDRVRGKVLYHPGIYENSYVKKIPGYFTRVLEYALENIRTGISKIPLLSKQEREMLIFTFNDTQSAYPGEKTIHGWFEEQVEKTPGHIAAAAHGPEESCAVTYRELNQRANRLARDLGAAGVTRGSMAAIMAGPSIGMLTAILAVLKTGAAYLPIDHEYPAQRIKYIIKDSHAGWLLMSQYLTGDIKELAPQLPVEVIILMDDEAGGPGNNTNPEKDSHPGDAVYLIYTSGSTGNPKGVVLEHRNLANYVDWFSNTVNITAKDKTILTSSFAFDLGYTSLYSSLLKGSELHLLPREIYLLPEGLLEYIKREEITYLKMTPSHFSNLVNHDHFPGGYCQSLRLVVLGGEPIDVNDVETVRSLYRSIQVMNHYGPTEATIGSVAVSIEFSRFEAYMDNPVIGKPIFNASVYILDRDLNLLPVGAAGELCISGACLARGYLNRPELTAEKFDHDLWDYQDYHDKKNKSFCGGLRAKRHAPCAFPLAAGGKRIYKTGDLARWLSDGNIQFLGRTDTQVKIRGYRIELGEIENQLIEHHQVEKVLVIIKEAPVKSSVNEHGDNYLYAYIVPPSADIAINITGFREYLAERLPGYMIPAYFIQLDEFPLTPNGKVDRKSLPEPGMEVKENLTPARNEVEKKLVEIWAQVLRVEKESIGIDSDFFKLGGHSLKATMLLSAIHKGLDVKIPLAKLFSASTIRELSRCLGTAAEDKFIPIKKVEMKEYYALSSAQKKLYILYRMKADTVSYNMPLFVGLDGKIDTYKIEEIFSKIIRRHESLRTSFHLIDGHPVRKINKEIDFKIEYFDFKKTHPNRQATVGVMKNFVRPFDLSHAHLLRVGLIRTPHTVGHHHLPQESTCRDRYILMVDMHHIVSDRTSLRILINEFIALYEGKALPLLRLEYKDYSEWQNSETQREAVKKQEEYWLKTFTGEIPVLTLPTDHARPRMQSFAGSKINFTLGRQETQKLNTLARENESTLFMILLALFSILLAKISGQEDIVIGTATEGRRHEDLRQVIGIFVNILAIRQYPVKEKTVVQFLKEVKENTLDAFENQDYPFEDLVEKVVVKRDTSRNPLFDYMFQFKDIQQEQGKGSELKVKPLNYSLEQSKLDLTLWAVETPEILSFTFEYCTALFKENTIQCFIDYFKEIVKYVSEDPAAMLADIEIVPQAKKQEILAKYGSSLEEEGYYE